MQREGFLACSSIKVFHRLLSVRNANRNRDLMNESLAKMSVMKLLLLTNSLSAIGTIAAASDMSLTLLPLTFFNAFDTSLLLLLLSVFFSSIFPFSLL
jgi:hypothetical protein